MKEKIIIKQFDHIIFKSLKSEEPSLGYVQHIRKNLMRVGRLTGHGDGICHIDWYCINKYGVQQLPDGTVFQCTILNNEESLIDEIEKASSKVHNALTHQVFVQSLLFKLLSARAEKKEKR